MRRDLFRGMGLIDVIVGIALMLIVFAGLFALLQTSLRLSILARAKAVSTELAIAQVEQLRALPYASLGTVGGNPSGTIPQNATTTVAGAAYGVRTLITYYDDPADGSGGADENHVTNDYKKAKVIVSYSLFGQQYSVSLVSNFATSTIET